MLVTGPPEFSAPTMSTSYRAAVCRGLPHATIVVDHFHVVQLANKMLRSSMLRPISVLPRRLWRQRGRQDVLAAVRGRRSGPWATAKPGPAVAGRRVGRRG